MKIESGIIGKIILAAIMIIYLFLSFGISDIFSKFSDILKPEFGIAFLLVLIVVLLNAIAIFALYRGISKIKFREFIGPFFASWVLGYIVPGKIGSLGISYMLKDKVPPGRSTAIFVIDKAITICVAAIIGFWVLPQILSKNELITFTVFFAAGIIVISFGVYLKQGRDILKKILGKKAEFFTGYAKTFPLFMQNPVGIITNLLFTIARIVLQAYILQILFSILGIELSIVNGILLVAISVILSLTPFTFSGLGVKENIFTIIATKMGLPMAESAVVALSSTALSWFTLAAFMFWFWKEANRAGKEISSSQKMK